jgi:hypothetical protein
VEILKNSRLFILPEARVPRLSDPEAPQQPYNLANFMRTLALPQEVKQWLPTTLRSEILRLIEQL